MDRVMGADERGSAPPAGRGPPRHTGEWLLRTNSVSFYLRSRLVLRPDGLRAEMHRTVLGFVPVGRVTREVPLADLWRVALRVIVRPARLIVAAGLAAAILLLELPTFVDAAFVLLAAASVFLGVALGIRVDGRTGTRFVVPVCVMQRGVAAAAVRQIGRALAARGVS